jgi:hypothetical protein
MYFGAGQRQLSGKHMEKGRVVSFTARWLKLLVVQRSTNCLILTGENNYSCLMHKGKTIMAVSFTEGKFKLLYKRVKIGAV